MRPPQLCDAVAPAMTPLKKKLLTALALTGLLTDRLAADGGAAGVWSSLAAVPQRGTFLAGKIAVATGLCLVVGGGAAR